MSGRNFSLVGVRLLGLYLTVQGILALPNVFTAFQIMRSINLTPDGRTVAPGLSSFLISSLPMILSPLIAGIVVLVTSRSLASWIYSGAAESEVPEPASSAELQATLFSVAGILIFVANLPQFVSGLIYFQQFSLGSGFDNALARVISTGLALFLGFTLFVGTHFWVELLAWFRGWGLESESSQPEERPTS